MGLWGGVGLAILVFGFGAAPGGIPGEVLLIILTVIMAASAMEAAGGIDFLVRIAAGIIRKRPARSPSSPRSSPTRSPSWPARATSSIPLLPVIYEVAMKGRVRPERPIAVATIASQQAITASPVSAATAALIAILGPQGHRAAADPDDLRPVHAAGCHRRRPGPDARRRRAGPRSRIPPAASRPANLPKSQTADAEASPMPPLPSAARPCPRGCFCWRRHRRLLRALPRAAQRRPAPTPRHRLHADDDRHRHARVAAAMLAVHAAHRPARSSRPRPARPASPPSSASSAWPGSATRSSTPTAGPSSAGCRSMAEAYPVAVLRRAVRDLDAALQPGRDDADPHAAGRHARHRPRRRWPACSRPSTATSSSRPTAR